MHVFPKSSTVLAKSEKGRMEIAQRSQRLSARQRHVLILVDGKRDAAALRAALPGQDVDAILDELLCDGYVQAAAAAEDAPVHSGQSGDEHGMDQAREYMIATAQSCLGLLAADLVARIRRSSGQAQLSAAASYWITAVRDSKYGGHLSDHYLEQLRALAPRLWSTSQ